MNWGRMVNLHQRLLKNVNLREIPKNGRVLVIPFKLCQGEQSPNRAENRASNDMKKARKVFKELDPVLSDININGSSSGGQGNF